VPKLSIVLTAHNEAGNIERVLTSYYNEISKKIPCEIVVGEDGSTDGTKEILLRLKKKYPMVLIMGDKKKGFKQACIDVLQAVRTPLVLLIDADDQYFIKDFWRLYRSIEHHDIAIGHKIIRKDPLYRNVLSYGFNVMVRLLFRMPLRDIDSGFRIIRKEVIDTVLSDVKHLKYGFTAEFNIRAYYAGFSISEVPIRHKPRKHGKTAMYPIRKLSGIIITQIKDLLRLRKELLKG